MKIKAHSEHRAATEIDVTHFEMGMGARLPDDYREFLIKYNGGYPTPNGFDGGSDVLSSFLGLWQKYADLNLETLAHRGFIPDGMIPIARDPGGNLVLLEVTRPNRGRIWFWDHEQSNDPEKAVRLLANSFTEFVNSLVPLDGESGAQ